MVSWVEAMSWFWLCSVHCHFGSNILHEVTDVTGVTLWLSMFTSWHGSIMIFQHWVIDFFILFICMFFLFLNFPCIWHFLQHWQQSGPSRMMLSVMQSWQGCEKGTKGKDHNMNTESTHCSNPLVNTLRPRKMYAISQTTFSNAFSWMKMFEFRLKFHWSLFPRV